MSTTERGRRAATVRLVGAMVFGLAACGSDEPTDDSGPTTDEPSEELPDVAAPDADIEVRLELGEGAMVVSWRVANTGDEPLAIPELLPRASGASTTYAADQVYVIGVGDGAVELSQRLFAAPDTGELRGSAQPPAVGYTVIAPGDEAEADFEVPLPLQRTHPYGNDLGDGEIRLPDPVRSAVFCLGVVVGVPEPSWGRGTADGTPLFGHGTAAVTAQHRACTEGVSVPES